MSNSPTIRRFVRSAWTLIAVQFVAGLGAAGVTIWAATEVRQLVNQRDLLMTRVTELETEQARRPAAPVEDIPEVTAEPAPIPDGPLPAPVPVPAPAPPPVAAPAPPPPRRIPPPRVVRPTRPVYTPPVYYTPPPPPPPPPPEVEDKPPVTDDPPPPRRRPRVRIPLELIGPLLGNGNGTRNPRNPSGTNPNNSNPNNSNPTRPPNNSAPPAGQRPSTNDPGASSTPPGSILRRRARPAPATPPADNGQQDVPR